MVAGRKEAAGMPSLRAAGPGRRGYLFTKSWQGQELHYLRPTPGVRAYESLSGLFRGCWLCLNPLGVVPLTEEPQKPLEKVMR